MCLYFAAEIFAVQWVHLKYDQHLKRGQLLLNLLLISLVSISHLNLTMFCLEQLSHFEYVNFDVKLFGLTLEHINLELKQFVDLTHA